MSTTPYPSDDVLDEADEAPEVRPTQLPSKPRATPRMRDLLPLGPMPPVPSNRYVSPFEDEEENAPYGCDGFDDY
jgi:hypothetical protein